MKRRIDWFLIGMVVAVGAAFAYPEFGARGGALHPEVVNKLGVSLIFFLHGLLLPFESLKSGFLRWPLHLTVQAATFLVFPVLGVLLLGVAGEHLGPELRTGLFFLCALPSTVSSSVALTAVARGNVAAAVLNATLSSVIGVFLTPLWIGLVLGRAGAGLPLGDVILDLSRWLLLPLAVGQVLRPLVGELARRHKSRVNVLDRGTILLLVYTSFCDSVKAGVWSQYGLTPLFVSLGSSVVLLFGVMGLVVLASRALGLSREDRIAAIFCGSKKSLASGVPMAQVIFAGHPALGLILLPILVYHALQLVVGGWLAGRWSEAEAPEGVTSPARG